MNRPHYDSLGQLMRAHSALFSPEPSCTYLERPLGDRTQGLSECLLRVAEADGRVRTHLLSCFSHLFGIYGAQAEFEVYYSCNAVLTGSVDGRWSIWYGLDYSDRTGRAGVNFMDADRDEEGFLGYDLVRSLGDVEDLRVDFDASQFSQLFFENHEESQVVVHSLCNICYIGSLRLLGRGRELAQLSVRHYMGNFPRPGKAGVIQDIPL